MKIKSFFCGDFDRFGFMKWVLGQPANIVIWLNIAEIKLDQAFPEAIYIIKKNEIKPWQKIGWVIPPEHNGSFVANMEKVLDVYKQPYDPQIPVSTWMNLQNN